MNTTDKEHQLNKKLIEKSQEAFLLAIEIYNKPTIKYRVEGFAFFMCNAWELMLKAHLLKTQGNTSIYYKDKPNRTISLSECIRRVFTNNKDPLRINLEKIIELRDTSTHFITEDYEMVYVPLFQSCILNYNEKIMQFHGIDLSTIIPNNFLTLSVNIQTLEDTAIIAKYPEEMAQKILETKTTIDNLSFENNAKFAINVEHHFFITKNKNNATNIVKIDNNSENTIRIVKELQNPNSTHKYTAKMCIKYIKEKLKRNNTQLLYNGANTEFNSFHFTNFCRHFHIKENTDFCYVHTQYTQPQYSYSQKALDFMLNELKKDPNNILNNIKKGS